MNLQQLRESGGIVPSEPIKKTVKWRNDTFNVFVVRQSFGSVEQLVQGFDESSRSAALIASFIRLGDDASEQMTYEDAYQLHPELAGEFVRVINEVYKDDEAKKG